VSQTTRSPSAANSISDIIADGPEGAGTRGA